MSGLETLRDEVAAACRIIGRLHLTREPNGHVSVRIPGTTNILIKARGPEEAPLSFTQPEDLAVVDETGRIIEGRPGLAAPSEVFIHTEILRNRPDVSSVIHIHPSNVVAFTIVERDIAPIIGAYNPSALRLIANGIPVYPRSVLINSHKRGQELAAILGAEKLALMRSHGIVTAGATVEDATLAAIHINDLADLQLKASQLGIPRPIPEEDVADILGNLPPDVRQSGPARAASSEWRYYLEAFGSGE